MPIDIFPKKTLKRLNITYHQGNSNQNHSELSPHLIANKKLLLKREQISFCKNVGK